MILMQYKKKQINYFYKEVINKQLSFDCQFLVSVSFPQLAQPAIHTFLSFMLLNFFITPFPLPRSWYYITSAKLKQFSYLFLLRVSLPKI